MSVFKIAYNITSIYEGGYINDPDDKGGETYRGIARHYWRDWEGWDIVDIHIKSFGNITRTPELDALVYEFYRENFWNVINGDLINDQDIANEVYDCAVSMSAIQSGIYLQHSLNLLNKNGTLYKDIQMDGKIGTVETLPVLNAHPFPKAVFKCMQYFQFEKRKEAADGDPKQEKFFYGWLNRI